MLDQFGTDTLRMVFAQLDRLVYFLIGVVYGFIKDLAGTTIFGSDAISAFSTKIYGVMGLFMLFKVSFSLLTYVVDPDSFSDKGKGMSTIAKNIIIVLIMIILAPFAFDLLGDAQNVILNENILERFVFGSGTEGNHIEDLSFQMHELCGDDVATAASDGHYVALEVFKGFYQPELDHYDISEVTGELKDTDYCTTVSNAMVSDYLDFGIYTDAEPGSGSNDYYTVNYLFLWSTIVGVVVLLLFVNVCIEIAKRAVKIGFLELIAPIPIISYVDPKSGKDGMFKKWLKELTSTWASLFIRLGAVYFAVYLIQFVCKQVNNQSDSMYGGIWMKLFIIIGCLMFAKELPKLIEKLVPGLNMSGAFNLNPIKNLKENTLGSKYISAAGAGALGFIGGGVANAVNAYKNKDKMTRRQRAGSVIAGSFAGGAYSMQNGYRNNNIFPSALSATNGGVRRSSANRNTRAQLAQNGQSWGPTDRVKDWWTDISGTRNESGTTSYIKNQLNDSMRRTEDYNRDEEIASRAMNEIMGSNYDAYRDLLQEDKPSEYNKSTHGIDYFYKYNAGDYKKYRDAKMANLTSKQEYIDANNNLTSANASLAQAQAILQNAQRSKKKAQQEAALAQYNAALSAQQAAQAQFDSYISSQIASESNFDAFINSRTDFATAKSKQSQEKFRQESLQKNQSAMKPTSGNK